MKDQLPPEHFTGLWVRHRPDGVRIEAEYTDGTPNGIYRYWNQFGVCLREGTKKAGLLHGKFITRSGDGTVLDISEFNEGTGVYRIFNSNGQMTDEIPWVKGKAHGVVRTWCFGKLVLVRYFTNGQCDAAMQP
jgi:antitoxin component YwqK of YwqJK toxin-antitoxin module